MLEKLALLFEKLINQQVTTIGLGLTRICYGIVLLQEILFLIYFNHLIFDPIPYLDVEYPMITFFLGVWAVVAFFLIIGFRTQYCSIINYVLWVVFVSFTSMQRDFDGGFDPFMTGIAFVFIFLPVQRSFSIDNLLLKLKKPMAAPHHALPDQVSILAYLAPVVICLGFLYFDSVIHKFYAPHWLNGLGAWLPLTQPYYISAIDFSWLLDQEYLLKFIGYSIIVFQLIFLVLYLSNRLRPVALIGGMSIHLGITLGLNIYPFGLGMLALYPLLVPFKWWRYIASKFKQSTPSLKVFYDQACPLCNRTVIIIRHFDVISAINFLGLQSHVQGEPKLQHIPENELLSDLYALDNNGQLYAGLDTYICILKNMRYLWAVGVFIKTPGVYQLCRSIYRKIADNRVRQSCDSLCLTSGPSKSESISIYEHIFEHFGRNRPKMLARRLSKLFVFIVVLQLNSTIHYGFLYRLGLNKPSTPLTASLLATSNSLLTLTGTFLGITPHALYLHDHFEGYEHVLAITYISQEGHEEWLPFVNQQGRIVSPNWGRVHSMWANIAVTPNIDNYRLKKFLKKVIAFWGIREGLNLDDTRFIIKLKKNQAPSHWIKNLRYNNLAQAWIDIGYAQWSGKNVTIKLPENMELL